MIRLGVPVLAYTLMVSPAIEYFAYRENEGGTGGFWSFFWDQIWHLGPGPTWFLEALLAFSLGYALLRALRPPTRAPSRAPLRERDVAGIVLAIAVTRLPPTSRFQSAASNSTCSSGRSRNV